MLKLLDVHDLNFYPEMFYKNVHSYNLILINYESLIKYRDELLNIVDSRTMLVFDEVHKIKNLESQKAQFAIELSRKANIAMFLQEHLFQILTKIFGTSYIYCMILNSMNILV